MVISFLKSLLCRSVIVFNPYPAYARRVFPCFDEPAFRASFKVKVVCDESLSVISNMPLDENFVFEGQSSKMWSFRTLPSTPPYLYSFALYPSLFSKKYILQEETPITQVFITISHLSHLSDDYTLFIVKFFFVVLLMMQLKVNYFGVLEEKSHIQLLVFLTRDIPLLYSWPFDLFYSGYFERSLQVCVCFTAWKANCWNYISITSVSQKLVSLVPLNKCEKMICGFDNFGINTQLN